MALANHLKYISTLSSPTDLIWRVGAELVFSDWTTPPTQSSLILFSHHKCAYRSVEQIRNFYLDISGFSRRNKTPCMICSHKPDQSLLSSPSTIF